MSSRFLLTKRLLLASWVLLCVCPSANAEPDIDLAGSEAVVASANHILVKLGRTAPSQRSESLLAGYERLQTELRRHDRSLRAIYEALITPTKTTEFPNNELVLELGLGDEFEAFLEAERAFLIRIKNQMDPLQINNQLAAQRRANFARHVLDEDIPQIPRRSNETREFRIIWGIVVMLQDRVEALQRHFDPYFESRRECGLTIRRQKDLQSVGKP